MINRILIRIKVVQMLYSYLLTRTDFKIESAPVTDSPDRKFAYTVYIDLLLMVLEFGGFSAVKGRRKGIVDIDKKLAKSKVAIALAGDDTIKQFIFKQSNHIESIVPLLQKLHDNIVDSSAYKDFKKRRTPSLSEEVMMWNSVFQTVVARDADFINTLRNSEGFTNAGLNMGLSMFVDTLNSYQGATDGYAKACADLERSLDKAYELYLSFFGLIVELTREQALRIEAAKNKFLATADDLNPNLRFVENMFASRLAEMPQVLEAMDKSPVNWNTEITLINKLLNKITQSQTYKEYMSAPSTDYAADCEFWREILRTEIFVSDELLEVLENKSVFWNDDLQIMGTFVLKTIRQSANNPEDEIKLLDKFKDDEDARFGSELFVSVVKNREQYRSYIDKFINYDAWDPERIAFMDIVIMLTAIAEVVSFPNIPLAVTMNEYVEIANDYSAPKSGQFINGILFNVVSMLREEGIVIK